MYFKELEGIEKIKLFILLRLFIVRIPQNSCQILVTFCQTKWNLFIRWLSRDRCWECLLGKKNASSFPVDKACHSWTECLTMFQELRNTTHLANSLNFNIFLKKILFYFHMCGNFLHKLSIKREQPQPRASACLSIFKSILHIMQRKNVITFFLYGFTFNRNYFFR